VIEEFTERKVKGAPQVKTQDPEAFQFNGTVQATGRTPVLTGGKQKE
jgi:hypothetical protein